MKKDELITHVAQSTGFTKTDAKAAVEAVFDCITETLKSGGSFAYPKFGTFSVKQTKERKGRNPQTGESITIKARNKVAFKVSQTLKEKVND